MSLSPWFNISKLGVNFYCQVFVFGTKMWFLNAIRKWGKLENQCTEMMQPSIIHRAIKDHKKSMQFLVIFLKTPCQACLKSAFIVLVMFYKYNRTTRF